jgi:hypothetical protein
MSRTLEVFSLLGKSQLRIELDYSPNSPSLEVRYHYPVSAVHVSSERAIRIPRREILRDVLRHIETLFAGLVAKAGRPPTLDVGVRPSGATIVIQDERQHQQLPLAWLTYQDADPGPTVVAPIKMDRTSFTPDEIAVWDRLRQRIKGIVWAHYRGAAEPPLNGRWIC